MKSEGESKVQDINIPVMDLTKSRYSDELDINNDI
ncbi:unnamed protein product [Acanthoscelides obtectus]|uniref:Uncharacterized protein n=1 Tax=Acanthoscelides obtectus TaxID=200917 RepID=A0A9P0LZT1_ACAOB|nr:unnamed protein product [Acanthoscelides obtectus]CAK1674695.1 hypothetical protein AOBTE_LOCUS29709 [Acanthoscelides obtectus]